jgi:hypothetical protein
MAMPMLVVELSSGTLRALDGDPAAAEAELRKAVRTGAVLVTMASGIAVRINTRQVTSWWVEQR